MINPQHISDKAAMDGITEVMSGEEWNADSLDAIADIVGRTGREISDYEESEDE